MAFVVMTERELCGVPVFEIAREGNVIRVGQFPRSCAENVCLTACAAWRLYMYQGNLVRKRWRHGDSVPREPPEEPHTAQVTIMPKEDRHEA